MEIDVTDIDFEEKVIKQSEEIPILVDFWAPWCSRCLLLKPVLEKIAKENENKFILAKVNIIEAKNSAEKYEVRALPSVKLFKSGKIVNEFVESMPEEDLKKWLDENLK